MNKLMSVQKKVQLPTTTQLTTTKCGLCGADATLKCGGCGIAVYYNRDHQLIHWKVHKKIGLSKK